MQSCWNNTLFAVKNINELVINEITKNKLLVFDDMQISFKKDQSIAEVFTRGRHNRIGIIQCEQFTQDTPHIEKENTDYIVLIPSFSLSSCGYDHKNFLSCLSPKDIMKLGSFAIKFSDEKGNRQLKYIIKNEFENIVLGYFYHVIFSFYPCYDGSDFTISLIKY